VNRIRATIAGGAIAGSMLLGGVVGAVITGSSALTASAATATPAASATPAAGTFKPNEDPTHEAGESAAREAQEDAGQVPNVP